MKTHLVLLCFIVFQPHAVVAQSDSLSDVFPLAIGNEWTYRFSSGGWADEVTWGDTGSAHFVITAKELTTDSSVWHIFQSRNLIHWTRDFIGHITTYPIQDSAMINLVEQHVGLHQLYTSHLASSVSSSVFPFGADLTDTTKVYRYRRVDSLGVARFQTASQPPRYQYFTFAFKANTGLADVSERDSGFTGGGSSTHHILLSSTIVSVRSENKTIPRDFSLGQNYPNPFNPTTNISFQIADFGFVSLKVFDVLGREAVTLVNEEMRPGGHQKIFDGQAFSGGVYFYRLQASGFIQTRKLLLLK